MTHTKGPFVLPCGCKIFTREYENGEHGTIDFCPLHKAAPDLLGEVKFYVAGLERRSNDSWRVNGLAPLTEWEKERLEWAKAAIGKAKPTTS